MSKAVVCIAESETQVETILRTLRAGGFSHNDISVIEVHDLFPEMETKPGWRKNPNGRGLIPVEEEETVLERNKRDFLDLKKTA